MVTNLSNREGCAFMHSRWLGTRSKKFHVKAQALDPRKHIYSLIILVTNYLNLETINLIFINNLH